MGIPPAGAEQEEERAAAATLGLHRHVLELGQDRLPVHLLLPRVALCERVNARMRA